MNVEIIGDGWFMIGELRHDLVMWWCIAGFLVWLMAFWDCLVINFVIWGRGVKVISKRPFFNAFMWNLRQFWKNLLKLIANCEK